MAWKDIKQRSLADSMLIDHDALKELDAVNALIDWVRIEFLLSNIHSSPSGEKAWPPLLMFKALLLQSWYDLSDPQLEKQVARDLLFRRFIGLDIAESVPDHTTFWRFRQKLEGLSLMEVLLDEINGQLIEQGLYIKSGGISIVDASIIQAKQNRPNKRKDGTSTQDPEADWNVKAGSDGQRKSTYGFKAHMNVDEDGFIKATDYSKGSLHDSNCFTGLLSGDESAVYADSAYASKAHHQWLKEKDIKNRIIKRAYRNHPLSAEDKHFNRLHAGVRCTVERVFGVLKQHYGMAKARYLGLGRNRTRFELMCVAHNMKRGISIQQASCV
jgi:IS5 family transposase